LSEKFRRFVILVSIRARWIHLSTLSKFAGPLHPASQNWPKPSVMPSAE
jgi:hypothetical protein